MHKISLKDAGEPFDVSIVQAARPARTVLFAVGRGGNPERHSQLLNCLAAHGCSVVAPHFPFLTALMPMEQDLVPRARRLRLAIDSVAQPGLAVVGVGHSIGATMLLALAGAHVWPYMRPRLEIEPDARLARLALLAPAMDLFHPADALDRVHIPIAAWAGTRDEHTPPARLARLERTRAPVKLHVCEGAGHFSFMDTPPPNTIEPLADREAFLRALSDAVAQFATEPHDAHDAELPTC